MLADLEVMTHDDIAVPEHLTNKLERGGVLVRIGARFPSQAGPA
jgi:hypothetical protein